MNVSINERTNQSTNERTNEFSGWIRSEWV